MKKEEDENTELEVTSSLRPGCKPEERKRFPSKRRMLFKRKVDSFLIEEAKKKEIL